MCCNHLGMMGGQIAHCGTMVLMLILYNVIILRSLMYNSVNNIKVCHTPPPKALQWEIQNSYKWVLFAGVYFSSIIQLSWFQKCFWASKDYQGCQGLSYLIMQLFHHLTIHFPAYLNMLVLVILHQSSGIFVGLGRTATASDLLMWEHKMIFSPFHFHP